MAAHSDISKGHEIANEVRRVNKQLKEAQGLSSTYNNRERLFGLPVTNVSWDANACALSGVANCVWFTRYICLILMLTLL